MFSIFPPMPFYENLSGEERSLFCCLCLQHRLGYAGFYRLLRVFETPGGVYSASESDRIAACPGLNVGTLDSLRSGPDLAAWERISARCVSLGVRVAPWGVPGYPDPLATLLNPPPLLFI